MRPKPFKKTRNNRWEIADKMFFSLLLTGSVIEFSQVGAGFVDGLVISRFLGPDAMAASGIAYPLFSMLGVISGLLAVGMQVRCTSLIGRGNPKEYSEYVSTTVYVGAVAALIVMALVLAFSRPFAVLLGASGNAAELAGPASDYLRGLGLGAPPLILTAILAPALQLDSGNKTIQTGALIETATNIIMDLLAVKLGLGVFGMGLATSIACYLNLLYQCTFFLKKDRTLHLVKPSVPVKDFLNMLSNGGEKAVKRLANTLRPVILNRIIISYGGAVAMSVLSVRNNFANFVDIFGAGIASAVSLLVGVYYGEINERAIRQVSSYSQKMIAIFSGSVCALVFALARPIARIYVTESGDVLAMTVFVIRMLALQVPLQALASTRIKYLQAIHRKLNMNLLILAAQVVFILASAFALGKLFGVYGILASFTVSDALSLLAVFVFYAVKCRRCPTHDDYLNLPDEFHLRPGDYISLDVRSARDVSLCSEQIMLFCHGHKIDRRTAFHAALAFEELATNVVKHGFPENPSSNPMIDLRAAITENTLVIRLRDNCPRYDVTRHIAAVNAPGADPTRNIGIRIVSRSASDVVYLRTFDTNSIILSFDLHPSPTAESLPAE